MTIAAGEQGLSGDFAVRPRKQVRRKTAHSF